ncbi:acyl-CoA synthetase short-chain family member 3, mitochondrial-like [Liolophura sinensis]|uniref:acyl-CoA synthetase short-chain family member 3, mitochondrial-like n=1 Tax=Liolophura sinensis TaxID=3198878 RepID=UPI0031586555
MLKMASLQNAVHRVIPSAFRDAKLWRRSPVGRKQKVEHAVRKKGTLSCSLRCYAHAVVRPHRSTFPGRALCSLSSHTPYDEAFAGAINSPEEFWAAAAEEIVWHKKWNKVLDNSNPPFTQWFPGGELNTTYNCLDRHVEAGHGEQTAIIYDSPITDSIAKISYNELLQEVKTFAGLLTKYGVQRGDRIIIYMPMIPQAIVVMLASARIGAIHALVFGGFAAKELSVRINHAKPRIIVSVNCGVEPGKTIRYKPILDEAINLSDHKPQSCIIYDRPEFEKASLMKGRDLEYSEEMTHARPVDPVPVPAMDPIYLLYTSGTTGLPKAVVRPSGGHAVALNWSMKNIYGIQPHEVWFAASDLGWVVGHSYINYAPLLNCNTTILFEGKPVGTPDPSTYFRIIKEHNVAGMFVAPTGLRAVKREDPRGTFAHKYLPCPKFRYLYVAGEHCDHDTVEWSRKVFNAPVLDNWWQTETGWAITATCSGLGMSLSPPTGVAGRPAPGWDVRVVRPDHSETDPNELGRIVIKLPLPPGSLSTLWENDEKFVDTFFRKYPGYYDTMDSGYRDRNGYIAVMSRADDVINVAGHRMSAGGLEEAVLEHEDVAEAAVIGMADTLKGQVPLGLLVLKSDVEKSPSQVVDEVLKTVRDNIGAVASFKHAVVVPRLPKTRSGKIPRSTIAALAASQPFQIPVTIEDATVYPAIKEALQGIGLARDA